MLFTKRLFLDLRLFLELKDNLTSSPVTYTSGMVVGITYTVNRIVASSSGDYNEHTVGELWSVAGLEGG